MRPISKNDPTHNGANGAVAVKRDRTFADFFAGIGLMRMGLERAGWNILFSNDNDPEKLKMYEGHFKDAGSHYCTENVHQLDADKVPPVMLATASFPCNDLSLAGTFQGLKGKQSSAFWGFIRVLEEMGQRKPPLVLLENVPGFLKSHHGSDFKDAMLTLNRLGYLVDPFMIDAAHFVPQSRSRLFVVAMQGKEFQISGIQETPTFLGSQARPKSLAEFILLNPDIRWSLGAFPPLPPKKTRLSDIIEDLEDEADEWWNASRAKHLLDQMSPRHRKLAEQMIHGSRWSYGTVFRRMRNNKSMAELRTDGVAGCLRTPRGGSGRQILFKAGKGRYFARLMTPREASRLMGADDYKITVGLNPSLFGFGDAVCVPVIEWLARHRLNPLADSLIKRNAIDQTRASLGKITYHSALGRLPRQGNHQMERLSSSKVLNPSLISMSKRIPPKEDHRSKEPADKP